MTANQHQPISTAAVKARVAATEPEPVAMPTKPAMIGANPIEVQTG